ncbi:DEAD/DEAH box helicase [Propionivibrio dicarboxylicus]|uniref:SNF2 family N-terminal domain-containing protein n=1 Tax=Propionivibrio dicarboxylicus TaxID=83767 RepID=A0A1G8C8A8_9RHOO|nr:DEAD/DEAH box helicase [Propionivibrio dicarboxylicus]SDH41529.1 SNF2 family N-terminal domain-containing protein [Propionivibrio dicarboxylicus]
MNRRDYTPRPYGKLMTDFAIDVPRCALWADMGLGKTVCTYTALDAMFLAGESMPTLVIAPLIVARDTWPDEARKWAHLRQIDVMPIVGTEAERRTALRYDASVYTVNFENLPWLIEHLGDRWSFRTVVVDEARKLKGFRLRQGGKRTAMLAKVAHTKVKRMIQLTGAPAPNGLADLWGQAWFLDAGKRLGRTYDAFRQRWFQKSFDGYGVEPLPFAQDQIQGALADLCLRVDAADWFDLEKPINVPVYVDLPVKVRAKYREMEKEMYTQIEDRSVEAFNAAARTQKCLQLANGAVYVDPLTEGEESRGPKEWREVHDVKVQALESIVDEANGSPVLVAYHFKSDLARLRKAFPKARVLSDPVQLREFKTGKYEIGLGHPGSMGHGVDGLQDHCHRIAFFGHWWDMDQRDQIIGRVGPVRQFQAGHKRPVYIYDIIARDTVDELVLARHETKRDVQSLLLEAMKGKRDV